MNLPSARVLQAIETGDLSAARLRLAELADEYDALHQARDRWLQRSISLTRQLEAVRGALDRAENRIATLRLCLPKRRSA